VELLLDYVQRIRRMWNEIIMAHFQIISQLFPRRTDKNHEIPAISITGAWAEIRTRNYTRTLDNGR